MKHLVVLTGAGMSAESGLATFRGQGGLWQGNNVYEVATPEAWQRDYQLVLEFYNWRRQQVRAAQPNIAHRALVRLERKFAVTIITQNVDDLHERAGSSNILHLHGEILKARSTLDPDWLIDLQDRDIHPGDLCPQGSQLRPHIVWFGEDVPAIYDAMGIVRKADILIVIGTSLQVYPAASLVPAASKAESVYVVNPDIPESLDMPSVIPIAETACAAIPELVDTLLRD